MLLSELRDLVDVFEFEEPLVSLFFLHSVHILKLDIEDSTEEARRSCGMRNVFGFLLSTIDSPESVDEGLFDWDLVRGFFVGGCSFDGSWILGRVLLARATVLPLDEDFEVRD